MTMPYPTDRKYTKDHEWIRVTGDTADIGITDYAQRQLGDVVFVELPDVGKAVTAGETFGSIESVKAVSELFAPVGGEVVEVNTALKDHPEAVHDPQPPGCCGSGCRPPGQRSASDAALESSSRVTFAGRHIGPSPTTRTMLAAVGASSLDALID